MAWWTLTNKDTHEIVQTIFFHPSFGNFPDYVSETAQEHKGRFTPELYDFDGENFYLKSDITESIEPKNVLPIGARPIENIVIHLVKQLSQAGFHLPIHNDEMRTRQQCKHLIDQAAGNARARFISQGVLTDQEYINTKYKIEMWRSAGSPVNDIPRPLQIWMNTTGLNAENAAQHIEQRAATFFEKMEDIMELRHVGKKAVDDAINDDFKAVAESYIQQLSNIGDT